MILMQIKLIGMELNDKYKTSKTSLLIYLSLCGVLSSCSVLFPTYYHEEKSYERNISGKGKLTSIPNDSIVCLPVFILKDTLMLEPFDEIIDLSNMLTHSLHGAETWYEISPSISGDSIFIDFIAHQFEVEERITPKEYEGVILYMNALFAVKKTNESLSTFFEKTKFTHCFNSIYNGTEIYFFAHDHYIEPEYAKVRCRMFNGKMDIVQCQLNNKIMKLNDTTFAQ